MNKSYVKEKIEIAESEINFGKMVKKYFIARDDLIGCSEDEKEYLEQELKLCEDKIKNKLFEMWREKRISITFE